MALYQFDGQLYQSQDTRFHIKFELLSITQSASLPVPTVNLEYSTTVSEVLAEKVPYIAVIVVDPVVTDVAKPFDPAALLIAAIPESDELQVIALVKFCVVLSE